MRTITKFTLYFLFLFLPPIHLKGNDLIVYVSSKNGNDRNSGNAQKPFQTIQQAKEYLKAYAGKKNNLKILLYDGTYSLSSPLHFTNADMPAKDYWYAIEAINTGKAQVSAAQVIKTKWSKQHGNIYKTYINAQDVPSLFRNNELLIRARYPNYAADITPFNGYSSEAINTARVRKWKNPEGAILHALHGSRWGSIHLEVKGKSSDSTLQLDGGMQINRPSAPHKNFRYIENVFEELDSINEWYFDKKNQTLYYYSSESIDALNKEKFSISKLENSITIKGSPANPITNFKIEGICFQHNTPTFLKTTEPLTRSDWKIYRNGVLLIENAEQITIKGNTFKNIGGNGVFVSGYAKNTLIENNYFDQIGASAISFVGHPSSIYNPRFNYGDSIPYALISKIKGPKSNEFPIDCIAKGNLITNIGLIEKQCAGVQINTASRIKVLHNSIYNTPRAGINIGDGAFGGHEIAYNDVYNTVLETSDHGAFNSWGRDRFWQAHSSKMAQMIERDSSLILLDTYQTTSIHHNRFKCEHGWDIDLDDGSSNYSIYNNLCLSGGIKLREGFHRNVRNNIMINNSLHPHVWFKNSRDTVKQNLVMTSFNDVLINDYGDQVDSNIFNNANDLKLNQLKGIDANGIAMTINFKNANEGNFTVLNPAILTFGFKNFDMMHFGVTDPALKKIVVPVSIPSLIKVKALAKNERIKWREYSIKNLETLGEQSATGMAEITGVLIVQLENSGAKKLLQINDVILAYNNDVTNTVNDLITAESKHKVKGTKTLKVWRNQQQIEIKL